MEQRLAEYRAARKRAGQATEPGTSSQRAQTSRAKAEADETPKAAPGWLKRFLVWNPRPASGQAQPSLVQGAARPGGRVSQPRRIPAEPPPARPLPPPPPRNRSFLSNITFLKVLLWLVLLGLFVELEFGLAYFVLSLFYWMYVGTRGPEEKTEGEKSAYSVFNPGCEAIKGTLTAEQLERELHLRPQQGR
ncbi:SAYSvFN domain-containing protein 1 [Hippopotamus amphibius kiboko]|uniref:SAYSvFN domain-containing protein 1 n=1 Tax=Hippopotamus amphibius kiboko TaxID=575201 RepID=UPI002596D171|nr:SAYSvFN domain-containing protein 1 [Hippopotamus amphibius kiboko]